MSQKKKSKCITECQIYVCPFHKKFVLLQVRILANGRSQSRKLIFFRFYKIPTKKGITKLCSLQRKFFEQINQELLLCKDKDHLGIKRVYLLLDNGYMSTFFAAKSFAINLSYKLLHFLKIKGTPGNPFLLSFACTLEYPSSRGYVDDEDIY